MKRSLLLHMALALPALCLCLAAPVRAEKLDSIMAVVEDRIITQSEVEELAVPVLERIEKAGGRADRKKVMDRALEELITRTVRDAEAARMEIQVSDADVADVIKQMEQKNNLPPGGLVKVLAKDGVSYGEYREDVVAKLLEGRIIRAKIRNKVTVTDAEIEALHRLLHGKSASEEVMLGHILLAVDSRTTSVKVEEQRNLAMELVRKLRSGEPLAPLAAQHSDDPSALKGGMIGWFKRGELMPEIEGELFQMEAGAVTAPLRSDQGFHIFQVIDRRTSSAGRESSGEEVRVRHILIQAGDAASVADEEARKKAQSLRERLNSGVPFDELADASSEDKGAGQGGDLGWIRRNGGLHPDFEQAAFALGKGEISPPVRTPMGWHLIQTVDRRSLDPTSLDAQRNELRVRLEDAKSRAMYRHWLRDKRQRAFVDIR